MKLKTGLKAGENSVNLTINIAQNSGEMAQPRQAKSHGLECWASLAPALVVHRGAVQCTTSRVCRRRAHPETATDPGRGCRRCTPVSRRVSPSCSSSTPHPHGFTLRGSADPAGD